MAEIRKWKAYWRSIGGLKDGELKRRVWRTSFAAEFVHSRCQELFCGKYHEDHSFACETYFTQRVNNYNLIVGYYKTLALI